MAVTRMRFTGNGASVLYIDLAKALSLQNRKLHRQKMIYNVYGGFFVDSAEVGTNSRVNLNTAPNTWVTKAAVNRGFRIWRKMVAKTLSETEGLTSGRYSDFKVFLNNAHGTSPMVPKDAGSLGGNDLYQFSIDWDYSTLTTADPEEDASGVSHPPDQFDLQIVGPHVTGPGYGTSASGDNFTRIGLIQSWVDTREVPPADDPITLAAASTDPLANLFDAGDIEDDRVTVISTEGDHPPYDEVWMFGNVATSGSRNNLQRQAVAFTTNTAPLGMIPGFQAICGLIEVDVAAAEGAWELVLDVESVGVKF